MKFSHLILALLLLPEVLLAGGTEITIHSGWSFLDAKQEFPGCPFCLSPFPLPPGESKVQQSMLFGFKAGYYLNKNIEVEGAFAVAPNHNFRINYQPIACIPELPCALRNDFFPFPTGQERQNVVAYQYEGNFVYDFPGDDVRPFFTFGVGGVSSDFENQVRTNFAFNYGGGAKFYFKDMGLRLEVNDHVLPSYFLNEKTEHDVQIQYGFLFRIP